MIGFERILALIGLSAADAVVLAGSAVVVLLMIGVAALLGFRQTGRLDQEALTRLAAAEGAQVEAALVDPAGKCALARLTGGKILIARVMADGVSARAAPAMAVSVRVRGGRLRASFGDAGFPALNLKLKDAAPAWLSALAKEAIV